MLKKLLLSILCSYSVAMLAAQQGMSLSEAIDYALANHVDVRVAQLSMKDADWQIKENRATAYPHLSLGLTGTHFLQQPALPAEALA